MGINREYIDGNYDRMIRKFMVIDLHTNILIMELVGKFSYSINGNILQIHAYVDRVSGDGYGYKYQIGLTNGITWVVEDICSEKAAEADKYPYKVTFFNQSKA